MVDIQCPLCHTYSESILHALRDCEVVKQVWYQLGENPGSNSFFSSNLQDWLEVNASGWVKLNTDNSSLGNPGLAGGGRLIRDKEDAKAIVEAIANPNYSKLFVSSLMEDCKLLVSRIPQVRFRLCYREANRCADGLARMGGKQASDFVFLSCPLVDLVKLLDFDFLGLYLNRLCPEFLSSS
ncbi:uncharacterized protein LOC142629103 [Castanea sativa]|uniref:uncharacterized protein LOC142629103 n=1 Tax=Castanea sativa TaxID=21020 RepID=UPI003F64E0F7